MLLIFYSLFIIYEEFLYKLLATSNYYLSIINSFFYYVAIASILALISNLLPNIIRKHFVRIITFIISFWYGTAIIVKRTFGITISFSATGMADQFVGGGFINLLLSVVKQNWFVVALVIIPFIISIILTKLNKKQYSIKKIIINLVIGIISFSLFIGSLFVYDNYNLNDLYFVKRNNEQNVEYFGVLPSLFIDIRKELAGFEEEIVIERTTDEIEEKEPTEEIIIYRKQASDFDFISLSLNEENSSIKQLHEYFAADVPTYKNEYTGLYEGKNLIYIMAESFDGFAVSEEYTPTLYKMIHNGFYFDNYYSVTNLSTIGGEFQELTGLIPNLTCLSWKWRESEGHGNYYPYGLGNLFKGLGYNTYAYHNHTYTFQDRNVYLKALGFDNYLGCGNGIENKDVNCNIFPESDDEMILGTYKDYINDEHFMVYYATVSGHMGWDFKNNDMAVKNQKTIESLEYSDTVKAFISANLELENAMTNLLKVLEENNRLDDTVIVLAADHHPYGLENEQMNELAGKELDQTFDIYKNNLIIYNPNNENVTISKPCSTIDILPTTLNLFNIPFDSRIIIGKDILSKSKGLVIFGDGSWLTSEGRFNINNDKFELFDGQTINEDYIEKYDKIVRNKILVSKNIMYYDYYRKLFNK